MRFSLIRIASDCNVTFIAAIIHSSGKYIEELHTDTICSLNGVSVVVEWESTPCLEVFHIQSVRGGAQPTEMMPHKV